MYRASEVYEEITKTIIDIYLDYDIKGFPIDEKLVCRKLGVALIPYSGFTRKDRALLIKKSQHGFYVPETANNSPTIFFNDSFESEGAQRLTIFHELKHYVYDDIDDEDDDLADFFARYFMCPIPYLLLKKIDKPNEIASVCGTSMAAAYNAYSNLRNRREKYGYHLFDYEIQLINHLEPILLEVYSEKKEGDGIYEGK